MVLGLRGATALERRLKYRFRAPELLGMALTHRSYANEQGLADHYERLEFLGDAVLGMIAAEWLYDRHPGLPEGELSRLKSYLVSAPVLGRYAQEMDLGEELRLGVGEERSGGRAKRSLLADSLEAVIGAVYLDGGPKAARAVIEPILAAALSARPDSAAASDAKTHLQGFL